MNEIYIINITDAPVSVFSSIIISFERNTLYMSYDATSSSNAKSEPEEYLPALQYPDQHQTMDQ